MKDQLRKFVAYEERMWRRFDRVFMCSDVECRQAEDRCPGDHRFKEVPNGVDISFFHPFEPKDVNAFASTLVFTAEMGYHPNEDAVFYFVTEIYSRIKAVNPIVRFDVVGRNPSKRILDLKGQDSTIRITGFVDDVRPYINDSAVYVVPLRIGGGTRLKILEALAMGKAVVSTTVGAEGLEVTDGENIVLADEPRDFAEKVVRLLNNPQEAKRLGSNGRKLVEQKYSWDIIGETIEREIQAVMNEK